MKSFGKILGLGCLGTVVIIVMLAMLGASLDDSSNNIERIASVNVEGAASEAGLVDSPEQNSEPTSKWRYSETVDEMRNSTAYFASINSQNTVDFDFPYAGSQPMQIQFRKSPAFGKDVIFAIERGQIVCDVYDCLGNISFDGKTERLTLARSADGTATVAFARYPDALSRKFRNSSKVVVELTFYQEGARQFIFETDGLEWPHF